MASTLLQHSTQQQQKLHIVYNHKDKDKDKDKDNKNTLITTIRTSFNNPKIIKINTKFYKFKTLYYNKNIKLKHAYIAIQICDFTTLLFLSKWYYKLIQFTSSITLIIYNNNNNTNLLLLHHIIQFSSKHHIKIIHL